MGKHYCDYCDVYLTHDSTSVRKAHNTGRNHIQNVRDYYMSLDPDAATTIVAELTKAYDAAGVQKPPALTPGAPGFGMAGPLGGAPQGFGQGGYGGQMGYRPPMMGAPGMSPYRPYAPPNPYSQPPPTFPMSQPGGMYARPPPHIPPPGMGMMPGAPPPLGMAGPPGMPPPLGMAGGAVHMRPPPNYSVPPPGFGGR